MIGCLRDRTLVRLLYEEGSTRQQRHLRRCARCSEQYAALSRARDVAATVLREAVLRPVDRMALAGRNVGGLFQRPAVRVIAPLGVAAAFAVALIVVLRAATMPVAGSGARPPAGFSLDDVVASAFTLDDAGDWVDADADDLRWQAALGGQRPCETQDGFSDPYCN